MKFLLFAFFTLFVSGCDSSTEEVKEISTTDSTRTEVSSGSSSATPSPTPTPSTTSTTAFSDTTSPTAVTLKNIEIGLDYFSAGWTDSTDADSGIDYYEVSISTGANAGGSIIFQWQEVFRSCIADSSSNCASKGYKAEDLTLNQGNTYYYNVRAVDFYGNKSAVSSIAATTPKVTTFTLKYYYSAGARTSHSQCTTSTTLLDSDLQDLLGEYAGCAWSQPTALSYVINCPNACTPVSNWSAAQNQYVTTYNCILPSHTHSYNCGWDANYFDSYYELHGFL
jgi:hypothetical protein